MKLERLKELAREAGFDAAGVAPAALLSDEVKKLGQWVAEGKNGTMEYMAGNMGVRENLGLLVEGARAVIVTLTGYYSPWRQPGDIPKIAMYARGKDYHIIVKNRLHALLERVRNEEGEEVRGRCFVDSAPILEHEWARRAGLGWQGKNTLLIRKGLGSFCFIGVIVVTVEFDRYDEPFTASYCGTCNRCVAACPTGALDSREVDARKCISYQTIENKGEYPAALKRLAGNRIFGCDICQEVCPWNRELPAHRIPELMPLPEAMLLTDEDWKAMDEARFKVFFKDTPLERTGLARLLRNL